MSHDLITLQYLDILQIAYWLSCYPLGKLRSAIDEGLTYIDLSVDVIKSRIQLRQTPPTGKPWKYMANEIRMVIAESGL